MTANRDHDDNPPRASSHDGGAGVETRHGFRAIGVAVAQVAAPLVKRRGGGLLARLKADWTPIVGEAWARVSWPAALGRDGALKLRVLPAAALDLQHSAPLVIERINLYFGRPVATRLVFVQGPLPFAPPSSPSLSPPAAGMTEALDGRLAGICDPDLRAALARLGRAVAAAETAAPRGAVAGEPGTD
jgi:hypothetical protein